MLAVSKRLRYFLHNDADLQGALLRIFLDEVERCLCEHSPGGGSAERSGAVAFIHRFGSSLNEPVHFHCCVIDAVFEPADTDAAPGVMFHAVVRLDEAAIAAVQAQVRRGILRVFVRRGLIEKCDAEEMAGWDHGGGFSVDAAVRIEGNERAGRERLLRSCARPPFALEQLYQSQSDAEHLVYHCPKPRPDGPGDLVPTLAPAAVPPASLVVCRPEADPFGRRGAVPRETPASPPTFAAHDEELSHRAAATLSVGDATGVHR